MIRDDLADDYAEGKWLATGGGGYALVDVVPRYEKDGSARIRDDRRHAHAAGPGTRDVDAWGLG